MPWRCLCNFLFVMLSYKLSLSLSSTHVIWNWFTMATLATKKDTLPAIRSSMVLWIVFNSSSSCMAVMDYSLSVRLAVRLFIRLSPVHPEHCLQVEQAGDARISSQPNPETSGNLSSTYRHWIAVACHLFSYNAPAIRPSLPDVSACI